MKNRLLGLSIILCLSILWTGCEKTEKEPTGSFTDSRDGVSYETILIGGQTWMAENLRYNAGGSWLNPSNPSTNYGRLYNWATVMSGSASSSLSPSGVQGICPSGWHLPSDAEWTVLENTIGASDVGKAMKSTLGWNSNGSENGTNTSGFNAFAAGYYGDGTFNPLGASAYFWSSTAAPLSNAWIRSLLYGSTEISRSTYGKSLGLSCRCVMD